MSRFAPTLWLCLALVACGTEPVEGTFDGTIQEMFIVKDAFTNSETISFSMVQGTASADPSDCAKRATVDVTPTTKISRAETPGTFIGQDALKTAGFVRVRPPNSIHDICPQRLTATSIVIVTSRP